MPNGTGKSTVLYAIASALGGGEQALGRDLLRARLRSPDAVVVLETDGHARFAVASPRLQGSELLAGLSANPDPPSPNHYLPSYPIPLCRNAVVV